MCVGCLTLTKKFLVYTNYIIYIIYPQNYSNQAIDCVYSFNLFELCCCFLNPQPHDKNSN